MSSKLFVGGLAWATTDASLRAAFSQFGEVIDAKVITDRETGRSRGFGFVTFADPSEAQQAMQMDGQELDGRSIRVNEAQERSRGPGGPPGDRRGGGRFDGPPPRRDYGGGGYGGGGGGYGGGGPRFGSSGGGFPPPPDDSRGGGRKRHNGGGQRKRGEGGGRKGGRPRHDRDDYGGDDW